MGSGQIAWARYLIRFDGDKDTIQKKVDLFLSQKEILVDKRTKRGKTKQIDLAPYLDRRSWLPGEDAAVLDLTLPAGSTFNLNPDLLLDALEQATGIDPLDTSVCRTQLLTADFKEFE